MFESIIQKDKELLIFLNNLGNDFWDPVWLFITKQFNWVPFFAVILFFVFKALHWKRVLFLLLAIAVLITFSDQFTNLIKYATMRLRPCNDPEILHLLRIVKPTGGYSFMSGHATTSTFFAVFIFQVLRQYYKYAFLVFIFPLFFGYSRLYLGVHFPIDVSTGYIIGSLFGIFYYRFYAKLDHRFFKAT